MGFITTLYLLIASNYYNTALIISDNFNIAYRQSHIPTTMATPIVRKSASAEILSPTIEDEIDSFVASDVENIHNDSSETLNLIGGACKYINVFRDIKPY